MSPTGKAQDPITKTRTSKIPRRDEQRLLTYAAAAGAALAATGTADATIVHPGFAGATVSYGLGQLTLNIASANRLRFFCTTSGSGYVNAVAFSTDMLRKSGGQSNMLYRALNDPINGAVGLWNNGYYINQSTNSHANGELFQTNGGTSGTFSLTRTSGYIGFRFDTSGTGADVWNYGWVQIADVNIDGANSSFKVVDWAYQDDGTGILAGAGGGGGPSGGGGGGGSDGGSVGAPEPGTVLMGLSALAIGAGYRMRQWRRKRA